MQGNTMPFKTLTPWGCVSAYAYPYDPGVHRAKHGPVLRHRSADLLHVVQQPAQLHRAEVGADGQARLGLWRDTGGHVTTSQWFKPWSITMVTHVPNLQGA